MTEKNNESMVRYLVIELLEAAFNLALSNDPATLDRLAPFAGNILRVKTDAPDLSFYLEVTPEGVQLYAEHEGPINARVRLSSHLLARHVLGLGTDDDALDSDAVKITGDEALVAGLFQIATEFSLWAICKRIISSWLPEYDSLEDLLQSSRHNDAAWMTRFEHLPQLMNEAMVMLREQGEMQRTQMEEILQIRKQLAGDRRASQVSTVIGFCLIVVAFLGHNGYLHIPAIESLSLDTLVMLIVGLVLLIPRVMGRR